MGSRAVSDGVARIDWGHWSVWCLVYWGLTPQQHPGSYQGGEMMMKSVFSGGGNRSTRRKPPTCLMSAAPYR